MPRVQDNKLLEWSDVKKIETGIEWDPEAPVTGKGGGRVTKTVGDAFANGLADKVYLHTGTRLYKFNGYPTLHGPGILARYRPVSPWWSPYDPYEHDPGWEAKKQIAEHFKVSVREWGRITSAVREDWNSLKYLLTIRLKFPVWAWWGGFADQYRFTPVAPNQKQKESKRFGPQNQAQKVVESRGRGKKLPGGGTQFYIPNLHPYDISEWKTSITH